jgi:hypothetical protein
LWDGKPILMQYGSAPSLRITIQETEAHNSNITEASKIPRERFEGQITTTQISQRHRKPQEIESTIMKIHILIQRGHCRPERK